MWKTEIDLMKLFFQTEDIENVSNHTHIYK